MKKFDWLQFCKIIFIVTVCVMISAPYIFAHRYPVEEDISTVENRMLEKPTAVFKDGRLFKGFPSEYDRWFADHLGFRNIMIYANAWMDYYGFDRFPDSTNNKVGKTGELVDGRESMVSSFSRTDLLSEERVSEIGEAYQTIYDWLAEQGVDFYFVQCVEKHEIYPEVYLDGVYQIGEQSRQEQVIQYLRNNTNVPCGYLKDSLLENKDKYRLYNRWADVAHWTPRGAYVGYLQVMDLLNQSGNNYKVLSEEDYNITECDVGESYYGRLYKEDYREEFTIKNPKAVQLEYLGNVDGMVEDDRHSVWINDEMKDGEKLLILGDSYFHIFLVDDFAESFAETWMMMGDYLTELPTIMEAYNPDVVIFECAQRANRDDIVVNFARELKNK